MAGNVCPRTLFHLVPLNEAARDALLHRDNKRFVSPCAAAGNMLALEIGFHVPSMPAGRVITKLGRCADLILCEVPESVRRSPMSAFHVAFEMHPVTLVVMLSVRAKNIRSVTVAPAEKDEGPGQAEFITGDCVILYGQNYEINVASYQFDLCWRTDITHESLRELAIRDYNESLERAKQLRSRDQPDGFDQSELNSWYMTRLHTAKEPVVSEVKELCKYIGRGAYSKVFETVDRKSGNKFVVKVVDLKVYSDEERARAAIHREIKVLERLKHDNIIDYLGHEDFHTHAPRIYMPLREGNLTALAKDRGSGFHDSLCNQVLEQMLRALDYLAFSQLCHRDVKPDNILYRDLGQDRIHLQLADFGMANHHRLATTFCGTGYYQAPELYTKHDKLPQTPKMDVWSLFATILDVHFRFKFPPLDARDYDDIVQAVRAAATKVPDLRAMARENPVWRASAAQMLVALFHGKGLTTPRAQVPPLAEEEPQQLAMADNRQHQRPLATQVQVPRTAPAPLPLIVYPPPQQRHRRLLAPPPRVAGSGLFSSPPREIQKQLPRRDRTRPEGIVKRRTEAPAKLEVREQPEKEMPMPGTFPK